MHLSFTQDKKRWKSETPPHESPPPKNPVICYKWIDPEKLIQLS